MPRASVVTAGRPRSGNPGPWLGRSRSRSLDAARRAPLQASTPPKRRTPRHAQKPAPRDTQQAGPPGLSSPGDGVRPRRWGGLSRHGGGIETGALPRMPSPASTAAPGILSPPDPDRPARRGASRWPIFQILGLCKRRRPVRAASHGGADTRRGRPPAAPPRPSELEQS